MSVTPAFRVRLWDATGSGRGRGTLKALIDDAQDIGISEQASGPGECFFTLPGNHPQIGEIAPLQRHIEVSRLSSSGAYIPVWAGLLDDYEATPDEVVVYGRDYLSLLDTTITGSNESYPSQPVGQIISAVLTAARAESDSRVNFIAMGTINNTSVTTLALSSYQSRLEFIRQLVDISMGESPRRAIISVGPRSSGTPSFNFIGAQGSDKEDVRLEYGGLVNDYFYSPGYSTLRTHVQAIGQKREGATVLYSTQSAPAAPASTYGRIAEPMLFVDMVDQNALDERTRRAARTLGRVGKTVGLGISVNRLGPWDGYDLGDCVRVVINDGIVSVNALYTVWGLEWIGRKNGSEELVLSLAPKDV